MAGVPRCWSCCLFCLPFGSLTAAKTAYAGRCKAEIEAAMHRAALLCLYFRFCFLAA